MAGRTMAHLGRGPLVFPPSPGDRAKLPQYRSTALSVVGLLIFSSFSPVTGALSFEPRWDKNLGIQPLQNLRGQPAYSILPASVRPLLSSHEQEDFLRELEGIPPDWDMLHSENMTEQSERLFRLNRQRDKARTVHSRLLRLPIAFIWSGVLRQFEPEFQGFKVALGPEITSTGWGLVRFKPLEIPSFMIATVPSNVLNDDTVDKKIKEGLEIGILFIGHLTENESLIYAFSHDDNREGMILPVVNITELKYFLR